MTSSTITKQSGIADSKGSRKDIESFYHLSGCSLTGKACSGTACFVARHLNPARWAQAERDTPRISCLGRCFAAPACTAGVVQPHMEIRSRESIILRRMVNRNTRTLDGYIGQGGYRALERTLAMTREHLISEIETAGLRGRGGAGFPTGRKWRSVLEQATQLQNHTSDGPYVIANADEGDAGAYIDHYIIEGDPFTLLEGMTIAARAVGARLGWIYLRGEHPQGVTVLKEALQEARSAGLLGDRILGHNFSFDVNIVVGRGSYVCGEETALIRSIEGRRPEVQVRPPMPSQYGLFGKPTLVNNVETLANLSWIVEHGSERYRALGFSNSRGTKAVSLNSLFRSPGLYEVEFGTTIREIVEEMGGGLRSGTLKGVIIGGPLAGIIPPHLLDTRFGFEELHAIGACVGHGGIIGFDEHTSIASLLHHVFSFAAYESCGKCTPCRLGSRCVEQMVAPGTVSASDLKRCRDVVSALKLTSLCGLGTGLAEFAESVFRHYGKELDRCSQ